jgi:hypothetical protein
MHHLPYNSTLRIARGPPTSIQIDYTSRHNPRQIKTAEKGNPNGINHATMKKKMVHELLISLTHATFVHHNDMLLLEVIYGFFGGTIWIKKITISGATIWICWNNLSCE